MEIQLELFEKIDEISLLKKELEIVRTSSENTRRGLFARYNELANMYLDLKRQMEEAGLKPHRPFKDRMVG